MNRNEIRYHQCHRSILISFFLKIGYLFHFTFTCYRIYLHINFQWQRPFYRNSRIIFIESCIRDLSVNLTFSEATVWTLETVSILANRHWTLDFNFPQKFSESWPMGNHINSIAYVLMRIGIRSNIRHVRHHLCKCGITLTCMHVEQLNR